MQIRTRRVYADPDAEDEFRILISRLWPRDLTEVHAK